jgi:hypothetical protein
MTAFSCLLHSQIHAFNASLPPLKDGSIDGATLSAWPPNKWISDNVANVSRTGGYHTWFLATGVLLMHADGQRLLVPKVCNVCSTTCCGAVNISLIEAMSCHVVSYHCHVIPMSASNACCCVCRL